MSELVGQVTQALQGMPADPAAHLEQLNAESERLATAAQQARQTHSEASQARDTLTTAGQTTALAEQLGTELAALDFDAAVANAETIADEAAAIGTQHAEAGEQERSLRGELDAVPSDDDGLNSHAIGVARTSLDNLPSRAAAVENAAAAARTAAKEGSDVQRRVTDVNKRLDEIQERLDGREQERQRLESAHTAAANDLDQATRLLESALQDLAEAADLQGQADQKSRAAAELEAEEAALRDDELAEAQRRATTAEAAYNDAQQQNAAAAAAHGLHAGTDECSVCARRLPDDWQPPAADDLDAARAEHESARKQIEELRRKADGLAQKAEAARSHAADLQKRFTDRMDRAHAHARDLAPLIQRSTIEVASLSPVPEGTSVQDVHAELLKPLSSAVETAHHQLTSYEAESQQLREQLAAAKADLDNAKQVMASAEDQAGRRRNEADAAVAALRSALDSLPHQVRFDVTVPDDPLAVETVPLDGIDAARQTLQARVEELDRRTKRRTELSTRLDTIREQVTHLDGRWESAVLAPIDQLVGELNTHRDAMGRVVQRLEISDVSLPPAMSRTDPAELVDKVRALHKATDDLTTRVDQLIKSTNRNADAATQEMARLAAKVHLPTDTENLDHERIVSRAGALADQAELDARVARSHADDFAPLVDPLIELQRTSTTLTNTHNVLTDLSAALKSGAFPKWLTLRRSRALLVHASSLLQQMSGGRYAFAELDDEAAEWRVVDKDSGLARTPASLSGGEKFIASLALALGMVEMMARSGGRLESLWLDEGFGALDRSNLDAAIEALEAVTARGRMVAVISHVRAVAEQVSHVLSITRDATGSKARWLEPTERSEIAATDLNAPDSALSGLIE